MVDYLVALETKHEILVTAAQAKLLLELLSKAAVPVPLAKIAGDLHDIVIGCVLKFEDKGT